MTLKISMPDLDREKHSLEENAQFVVSRNLLNHNHLPSVTISGAEGARKWRVIMC